MKGFIARGILGVVILIGVSLVVASLVFYSHRSLGTFYPFFPAFFPFHFGLMLIFLVFIIFLIARWFFWLKGKINSHGLDSKYHDNALNILKEQYAKGGITKDQFEQMMLDLKRTD